MKSRLCILVIFSIFPLIAIAQKVDEMRKNRLSLTFSIAPTSTYIQPINSNKQIFSLTNFYSSLNFNFHKRFTFSTGLHWFNNDDVFHSVVLSEYGYRGPTTSTYKYNMISIPTRLLFNVNKPNEKVNFYIKTELSNSLIIYYTDEYPNTAGIFESNTSYDYGLALGFGAGIDLKIKNRLSLIIEPTKSYSITGSLNTLRYFDCQIGFKYKLEAINKKNKGPNT